MDESVARLRTHLRNHDDSKTSSSKGLCNHRQGSLAYPRSTFARLPTNQQCSIFDRFIWSTHLGGIPVSNQNVGSKSARFGPLPAAIQGSAARFQSCCLVRPVHLPTAHSPAFETTVDKQIDTGDERRCRAQQENGGTYHLVDFGHAPHRRFALENLALLGHFRAEVHRRQCITRA